MEGLTDTQQIDFQLAHIYSATGEVVNAMAQFEASFPFNACLSMIHNQMETVFEQVELLHQQLRDEREKVQADAHLALSV
jgi:hypothetical protein